MESLIVYLPYTNRRCKRDYSLLVKRACGLLELAEHVDDLEKPLYIFAALKILKACDETFNSGSDTSVPIL